MAIDSEGKPIDWSKLCVKPQVLGVHVSVVIPLIFGWPLLGLMGWLIAVVLWVAVDQFLEYKGLRMLALIHRARLWFSPNRQGNYKRIQSEQVKKRYW